MLDLLLTKAVSDRQVVAGKFVACLSLITLALLCLPYWIDRQHRRCGSYGAIACGYLALLCMSAAYIAIGIYASSLTNNQIVAFLIGLVLVALFHLAFSVMASSFTGVTGEVLPTIEHRCALRQHEPGHSGQPRPVVVREHRGPGAVHGRNEPGETADDD